MEGTNLGNIYYTVDADTSGLLAGSRGVESATRTMNKSFEQTDRIATKLTATFSAVTAALSTNKILAYGEAWVNVNNKLSNSVKEHEKLADVTQRVFDISQNTRASISATADLYQKLESSTREAGKSGAELAQIAETINKALVVSGATAQGAESVILQLGQALGAGAVQGEEFNAIADNGQRIVKAIAKEMGVATGALKKLASEGKITSAVVINALTNSAKEIATEFDKMQVTMSQSFTIATNNLTKFIGESAAVNTVMGAVGSAAVTMSTNLDEVANVATVLAVVMGSKLAGSFVQSAAAKLSDAKASQASAVANSEAAAAVLRRAIAEKESTVALLAKSRADVIATKGTNAHAFALEMQKQRFTAATNAIASYNAAMVASASASRAASVAATIASTAMNGLKTAMSFLGGPVGVALLAAYAIYEFGIKADETRDKTKALDGSIEELTDKYKKLGEAQAKLEQFRVSEQLDSIYPLLSALEKQKTILEGSISAQEELAKKYKDINPKTYDNLNASIATQKTSLLEVNSELETQYNNLDRIEKKQELINKVVADGAVSTNKPKTGGALTSDQIKNIEAINSTLADQRAELTKTADGYEEYALRKQLAAAGASEVVIQASLRELKAQQELRREIELMNQVDADTEAQRKKKQDRRDPLTKEVTNLAANPIEKIQADLQEKYDLIAEYEMLETSNHQVALDARAAADREYESKKMAALEQMFVNESEMNALIVGSLNSLQSASTNVFSGLLSQTMTAKEAVSAFSNAIVNELIGSLVSVGIQYVKNAVISQSADQAVMASKISTQAANAALHTAAVSATVTELVALGAAGAYAATAAIPIVGPAAAPAASAAAAGAIGAVGSAAIAAAPVAGMRLYGGSTAPNSMYQVTENGRAEMFSDGRDSFLMTGSRGGSVTANGDLGGNSQPIINITTINNANGTDVSVQQSTKGNVTDVKFIVDTVTSNIASGGKIRSAITQSTTAKNRVV